MENTIFYGIVVRDFHFENGTSNPLKYPYGYIHPETEDSFAALKAKTPRDLIIYINSVRKEENIQFICPECKVEASQQACKNNDNAHRGDLVSYTYHVGSNGLPQARDVKVEKAFADGQSPFYAEEDLKKVAKDIVKGSPAENAINCLIDEFDEEYDDPDEGDDQEEYTDEELALLDQYDPHDGR